jgi:hypothetical protein
LGGEAGAGGGGMSLDNESSNVVEPRAVAAEVIVAKPAEAPGAFIWFLLDQHWCRRLIIASLFLIDLNP